MSCIELPLLELYLVFGQDKLAGWGGVTSPPGSLSPCRGIPPWHDPKAPGPQPAAVPSPPTDSSLPPRCPVGWGSTSLTPSSSEGEAIRLDRQGADEPLGPFGGHPEPCSPQRVSCHPWAFIPAPPCTPRLPSLLLGPLPDPPAIGTLRSLPATGPFTSKCLKHESKSEVEQLSAVLIWGTSPHLDCSSWGCVSPPVTMASPGMGASPEQLNCSELGGGRAAPL